MDIAWQPSASILLGMDNERATHAPCRRSGQAMFAKYVRLR